MTGPLATIVTVEPVSAALIAELATRLVAFRDLVPQPVDIVQLINDIGRPALELNVKRLTTVGANQVVLGFEPSERTLRLLAALRDLGGHGSSEGQAP